jgi:hypothetical protein
VGAVVLRREGDAPNVFGMKELGADRPVVVVARRPHHAELVQAEAAAADDTDGDDVAGSHVARGFEAATLFANIGGVSLIAEGHAQVIDAADDYGVADRDALAGAAIRGHFLRQDLPIGSVRHVRKEFSQFFPAAASAPFRRARFK